MAEVTIPKKKWTSQSIFSLLWQLKRLRKRLEKIAKKCYQISYPELFTEQYLNW